MRPGVFARCAIEPLHRHAVDLDDRVARQVVRIGDRCRPSSSPARSQPRPRSNAASTSADGRARDPVAHDAVDLVPVLDASGERREPRVVAEADERHHAVTRPTRPTSRSRPTCRRRTGRCRAAPSRGCPSPGGAARSRAVRCAPMSGPISWKQRLEQVDVDDLADARVHAARSVRERARRGR